MRCGRVHFEIKGDGRGFFVGKGLLDCSGSKKNGLKCFWDTRCKKENALRFDPIRKNIFVPRAPLGFYAGQLHCFIMIG